MSSARSDLPGWLGPVAGDPIYDWAVSAWTRAAGVPGAWFDHAKADAVVAAWPTIFRLTDDRFRGLPFVLLPWQEFTIRLLVGWKRPIEILDPVTHRPTQVWVRIFRQLDLWIPRKNGKSEFLAALAVLFFVLERVDGAQAFVFGRNLDQGRVPFTKMKAIIAEANGLAVDRAGNPRIELYDKTIYLRESRGLCELLTGRPDGKHGRSPTVILGDEIHEWISRELSDTLRQGTGTRLQPIELYASTTGNKRTARVGYEWWERSMAILSGAVEDASTLVVWFGIAEEDDWENEATWRKANPSLGLTPTLDYLRGEYTKAKGRPVQEALFQCFHLGRWVDQVGGWLPKARWRACTQDADGWKSVRTRNAGRRAYLAHDISATRDITALVALFPPDEAHPRWEIAARFWIPEATLEERAEDDRRVDWRRWVQIGALEATPGNVVDQSFVQVAIAEAAAEFDVAAIGYDPWNALKLMTDLQADGMDPDLMHEMRQGPRTLGEATKNFERLVFGGELDHGGHPVLAWMAGHCTVRLDANLNYVPDKKNSRDKIDGIVAAVMALALAQAPTEEADEPQIFFG